MNSHPQDSTFAAICDGGRHLLVARPASEPAETRQKAMDTMNIDNHRDEIANEAPPHSLALRRLIEERSLHTVFQPILDLRQGQHFACEALIRGPEDTALHTPAALFAAAAAAQCTHELEWLAVETAILQFAEQQCALRLFVNMSIGCLHASRKRLGAVRQDLLRLGVPSSRIVIELTENESVTDFSDLQETLLDFRQIGIQIAMDDMGEGFSNLRMWSEVRPEYVKIDRHFVSGIDTDPLKLHFVRAMHELADACGSALIAEGVETDAQLAVLRDLGIPYLQGFGIAQPHRIIPPASRSTLPAAANDSILVLPTRPRAARRIPRIDQLLHELPTVSPEADNDSVYRIFAHQPALNVIPVVANGQPLGMITRSSLIDRFARPFRRELYGKRACAMLMDTPLLFDEAQSVQEVAQAIGSLRGTQVGDSFVITRAGRYRGVGFLRELMAIITDMQIRAARYANPLTQLPGNVPINEQMDRLIEAEHGFVAAYCDLDHFKPYNDAYGYRRGDRMIQQVGTLLTEASADQQDFVGHVGGDDFIVLMQSRDWETRLRRVIGEFDTALMQHVTNPIHIAAGGYYGEDRRGGAIFHPLPALSIGCVIVQASAFASHHDVAAALSDAKKQAKRIPGSTLFVERRQYPILNAMQDKVAVPGAVSPAPTPGAPLPSCAL
ncbi:MAG: GGDEF domain-containing protein [Betaproteobacteria bacterium]|nr:GGDEF domain-containing protein [Betaproteobacteria bacterium]